MNQFARAQAHVGALPLRYEAAQTEALLELTAPTRTADDIAWESRLAHFPHLHRWTT